MDQGELMNLVSADIIRIMSNNYLFLALSSRLNSRSLNLIEKCTLAKNVFLSNMVKSTQKECIVLEWILKTIIEKFTAEEMDQSKLEPLWKVLTALAEAPVFEQCFISVSQDMLWDFLSAIVDNLHVRTTEVNSSVVFMKKIFQVSNNSNNFFCMIKNHCLHILQLTFAGIQTC